MTIRDWVILITTFIVGVLSGVYFYVTAYNPIYVQDTGGIEELLPREFSIIGLSYGGMVANYNHPSFRLSKDGGFDYFPGGTTQQEKVEGILPAGLFESVQRALAQSELSVLSRPVANKSCISHVDGIEYEYNIALEGVEYELDTCKTAFENDTRLGESLLNVWRYLESPEEFNTDTLNVSVRNLPKKESEQSGWRGLRGFIEDGFIDAGFDSKFDD